MQKLEVGKDYANMHNNNVIVIDRCGDYYNKGFDGGEFKDYISCSNHSIWREATKEEVIEAFEKHLNHRFGEDWKTMKIKGNHPSLSSSLSSSFGINNSLWNVGISKHFNGWNVWNKNGLLYRNGIWVERLEEEEKLEKIHIKEAIKENTVIHCETKREAERILGVAHKLGYKWGSGGSYKDGSNNWDIHESKTCYRLIDGTYSDYYYFNNKNYTIIPSTQIADLKTKEIWTTLPKDFEYKKIIISSNADKKRYEIIKTALSDFKQVSLGDNKTNKVIAHFVNQDEETLTLAEKIVDILNLIEK